MDHLVGDVDDEAVYGGAVGITEISVLSAEFCHESKTTLKKMKAIKNKTQPGSFRWDSVG